MTPSKVQYCSTISDDSSRLVESENTISTPGAGDEGSILGWAGASDVLCKMTILDYSTSSTADCPTREQS